MGEDTPELLTIPEACRRVGVTRRTMYNWIKDGKVEVVHVASGSVRIVATSLWRPAEKAEKAP